MSAKNEIADALATHELTLTRVYDAPPALLFKLWTQPEHLARWWGPHDFTVEYCEMDVRPGGSWRTCIRSAEGEDFWMHGVYREIIENKRLTFTFIWNKEGKPDVEMLVAVSFAAENGKTRLTFHETGFSSVDMRDMDKGGWGQCLERLATYTATTQG